SAIEMLEEELRDASSTMNFLQQENTSLAQPNSSAAECFVKRETNIVRVDHMALALSRTFKSTIVDIIQSLPQHQQIVLCSMVKLFRGSKNHTTVGEMYKEIRVKYGVKCSEDYERWLYEQPRGRSRLRSEALFSY
ncbi:Cell division control protein 6-like protein, partial [Thalictrum thalictroides]